ncbi:hypothetical protein Btru_076270 [Bulinus truncatus]|nr:hypothetical protein Btru_076270 [Bulinus truncatus]
MDSLLPSEWLRLEKVVTLLEPFAVQTDILQSDTQSLSTIIPSLVNLECHLEQSPAPKILTSKLLRDFRSRFEFIFNPECISFNPLPAAACLLDPSLADVLFSPDLSPLLNAAKMIIYTLIAGDSNTQGRDAELQLNGNLVGYLSDFGGSGMAFNVALPPLTRITLLVSDTQTIWTMNGDPITMNYYQNPNWFALNSQSELPGAPVNNDMYLGINQVILPSGRTGSGVCKVGLKFLPVY